MQTCITATNREGISFENAGQKIFGIIHLPEGNEQFPVVVILHGFASHKVGTNRSYVILSENLAKAGIASLRFDFRGAGDSEGHCSEMSLSGLISDASSAFEYVLNDKRFDKERIGIFGSSLGGSIGVVAAARFEKIKSLVLWAPVASGQLWYRDWLERNPEKAALDNSESLSQYNGVSVNSKFQKEFAQLDAAKEMEKLNHLPLLHIHGERDTHISLMHQKAYEKAREHAKAPSSFIVVPDSEHMLGRSLFFPQVVEEAKNWFKTYL